MGVGGGGAVFARALWEDEIRFVFVKDKKKLLNFAVTLLNQIDLFK